MKVNGLLIFLLLSLLMMTGSVYAQEKLFFGTMDSPLAQIGKKILHEAYQRMGIQIDARILPAERALYMLNGGKFDGEVLRIKGLEEHYPNLRIVPVPVIALEGVVFTKDVTFEITGWESLKPYKIGILRGSKFAEKGTQGMKVEPVTTYKQVLLKLYLGRNDVAVMDRTNGLTEIRKLNMQGIRILEPPLVTTDLYHYLHKKHENLIPKITQIIQEMVKEGVPKKIWEEYYTSF